MNRRALSLLTASLVLAVPACKDDVTTLRAYRARLLARPSFKRAMDEARPYRPLFPLGAPDRD